MRMYLQGWFEGRYSWFLALGIFLSAYDSGCRRSGSDRESITPAREMRPAAFLEQQLRKNEPAGLRYLNARANLTTETEGQTIGADAHIIWIRDSVLWINIKKFGIEAVRALATPDSVTILNRIERTYSVKTWEDLRRQYSLPAGFELLQPTLLSRAWLPDGLEWQSGIRDSLHRLSAANQRFSADYRLEEGSFRLRQESFLDLRDSRSVTLRFDRYKNLSGAGPFSYLRRMDAFSPEHGSMRAIIELSDVEVNVPKAYRFEIPSHYQRVD